jgi:hypothetical protein
MKLTLNQICINNIRKELLKKFPETPIIGYVVDYPFIYIKGYNRQRKIIYLKLYRLDEYTITLIQGEKPIVEFGHINEAILKSSN